MSQKPVTSSELGCKLCKTFNLEPSLISSYVTESESREIQEIVENHKLVAKQ